MDATTRWTAVGNGAIGCWLLVAPIVFDAPAIGRWNDAIVGAVIVLVAGTNYARATRRRPASAIGSGLVAILGLWLVVAPFALGFEGVALWNDVVAGTVVASFAGYNAYVATLAGTESSLRMTAKKRP
ncbi:SPW repeat domain-containing protein [Halosolutus halophilus]|uniref:SPW repeat domain-containing protein n=1 Tax=Halosolutus halophilus TaxID=1552990 RepID=UPI002234F657|nr:SPW repeat protein [Halosolutus halophilus]